jgi:6-phosphofructo-2-kinase/fructose-2,6-biphosphatase 4
MKSSTPALNVKVVEKPQMLEINPGIWDGLSPAQAKKYYPEDWERFLKDPYSFRVPRAESYHDLSGMHCSCHFLLFSKFPCTRLQFV